MQDIQEAFQSVIETQKTQIELLQAFIQDLKTISSGDSERIKSLVNALAGITWATHMKIVQHAHGLWYCPICKAESKSLFNLEQGIDHRLNCEYAFARQVLHDLGRTPDE